MAPLSVIFALALCGWVLPAVLDGWRAPRRRPRLGDMPLGWNQATGRGR